MGFVEAWVREKPIRTFLARLAQRRAEAATAYLASTAAAAAIDGEGGGVGSIPQLSSIANSVVSRCSRILALSTESLQQSYETDFPHNCNEPNTYARELLEYCCHKALHEVTTRPDYLADKNLRRLMFDMMLAWETPGSEDASVQNVRNLQCFILLLTTIFWRLIHHTDMFARKKNRDYVCFPDITPACSSLLDNFFILYYRCDGQGSIACDSLEIEDEDEGSIFYANSTRLAVQVDDKKTVGLNAFSRIAPSCPIIADLVTVHNLFDALTSSSGGRLHFLVYDKYLKSLDRELRSVKSIMQSPLASSIHLDAGECILAIDGDKPIHPVLQHIGISAWPGRLVLTTHALYFQSIRVGYGDNIVKYDLATDSNQVIKRDLTGPLGVRLFDKAVMYKSSTLTEPIYFDFPELGGPSRRDYWLAITREVLQVNRFIRKFNLGDVQRAEALSKAILGILRYSAVKEAFHIAPSHFKTTLTFSLAEKLPKGDMVLEALYNNYFQLLDSSLNHLATDSAADKMSENHSVPFSLYALSRMGFLLLKRKDEAEKEISFCAVCFGVTKSLEAALEESICYSERIESARATIDQVKVEGIDANLALMQELLFPFIQVGKIVYSLSQWEDPLKSLLFLAFMLYVIQRGLVSYIVPFVFLTFAVVILWHKYIGNGKMLEVLEVKAPPSKNAVEQILTLQEAISKLEDSLQGVNIALLKFRSVLFASVPKATEVVAAVLMAAATFLILVPSRHLLLMLALELYTREMPLRKQNTEKFRRRVREWWARIPAAPVQMIRPNETKKKR